MTRRLFAAACIASFLGGSTAQALAPPVLVKLQTLDKEAITGELISEDEVQIEVLDLKTGQPANFPKKALQSVRKNISESEAIASAGLAKVLAWKVNRAMPLVPVTGKVADDDPASIYVT